jgi:hypothetical protein
MCSNGFNGFRESIIKSPTNFNEWDDLKWAWQWNEYAIMVNHECTILFFIPTTKFNGEILKISKLKWFNANKLNNFDNLVLHATLTQNLFMK